MIDDTEKILEDIDALVKLGSETALEFGWLANKYFESEKQQLLEDFGSEAAALHETITFLHDREAEYIVARSTVADRMRVTRYMTRETYNDIALETHKRPSFHQLRACLITDKGVVIKDETDAMVEWCIENEWPTVAEIRERRCGVDKRTPEDRRWEQFVRLARRVLLDYFPTKLTGRYTVANSVVEQSVLEAQYV
jgi:hypothetical protein